MLRLTAPAKINLYLHVGGKRADGYHTLESLVCFAEAGDTLRLMAADALSLRLDGPFSAGLESEPDNLVLRAARALAQAAGIQSGAAITLTKNLPVASGIGGGSADAAAALRGLSRLWEISIAPRLLQEIALSLGSDVPVCVASVAAQMSGRGEQVRPLAGLPPAPLLLINPGVSVSTGEVFRRLGRSVNDPLPQAPVWHGAGDVQALAAWLAHSRNDMEDEALAIAPAIGEVLDSLRGAGALLARMCGSGATCYALFAHDAALKTAADGIAQAHPRWWVRPTRIVDLA